MKAWRTIQKELPRVGNELRELGQYLRSSSLPLGGTLMDQRCRYVDLIDWLMAIGAIRNG